MEIPLVKSPRCYFNPICISLLITLCYFLAFPLGQVSRLHRVRKFTRITSKFCNFCAVSQHNSWKFNLFATLLGNKILLFELVSCNLHYYYLKTSNEREGFRKINMFSQNEYFGSNIYIYFLTGRKETKLTCSKWTLRRSMCTVT